MCSRGSLALVLLCLAVPGRADTLPAWDFGTGSPQGWQPNASLRQPSFSAAGLESALVGTDPWLVGPSIAVDAAAARYVHVRLRIGHHGGGSIYFSTNASPDFSQARHVRFRVRPGGDWQDLLVDMRSHPAWVGTVTRLRLDPIDVWPNIPAGQPVAIAGIRLLPPDAVPAAVRLTAFHAGETWRVLPGATWKVRAELANRGGQSATLRAALLRLPDNLRLVHGPQLPISLAADGTVSIEWQIAAVRPGVGQILALLAPDGAPPLAAARLLAVADDGAAPAAVPIPGRGGRLALPGEPGFAHLQVPSDPPGTWTTVGTIPAMATVFTADATGSMEAVTFPFAPPRAAADAGNAAAWLVRRERRDGDGRLWTAELTLKPHPSLPLTAARLDVFCEAAAVVHRLDGPEILMADVPEAERQGGLFAGLEWLEGAEASWNPAADRSDLRIRHRPHRNRITIPVMTLAQSGGRAGWLWQPGAAPPGAVFGAPTREVTGRRDAVMGLFLPAVRSPAEENADFGSETLSLAPGQRLTIGADLLLAPASFGAGEVCRLWVTRFGLPAPTSLPRGTWRDELAFTMTAFLDILWVEEENAWVNGLGPSRNMGRFGPFLTSVLLGARYLPDPIESACTGLLARTAGEPDGFRGTELPWFEGSLLSAYGRRLGSLQRILDRQHPNGGWNFGDWLHLRNRENEPKLLDLGAPDRFEVGFGAGFAAQLLSFAQVTGDPAAGDAGLRALEWLDTFAVPRAAQCWEVPAHAPDIVAAADAIRACAAGYRLTGDAKYLRQAESWAERGLPFLYLWSDPAIAGMRYGSIPVLGATWYTGAWYGRPVQWCGLNYAGALAGLIEAGVSEPWTTIRDGLLASGCVQQLTEPANRALIPDAIDLVQGGLGADYWVPPYTLAMGLAHRLGARSAPSTATASGIRVSGVGEVTAGLRGEVLNITVRFTESGAHHLLVAGIGQVGGIRLGDREVLPAERLVDGDGWCLAAAQGLLEIRLARAQEASLTVTGVGRREVRLLPRGAE
ncbi:MAG: hypothetical protein JXR77_11350 [Lentisphaeria bacterium]|nr:hypothetical protein [Lentisphaeria bacterium]